MALRSLMIRIAFGALATAGVLACGAASAVPVELELPLSGERTGLKPVAGYVLDAERRFTAPQLFSDDAEFEPWSEGIEAAFPGGWIRLDVRAPDANSGPWVLTVKRRYFRELEIFVATRDGRVLQQFSNGVEDYRPGLISGQRFVYPLAIGPGQRAALLLRVDTLQKALSALDLELIPRDDMLARSADQFWALGLYFGAVVALVFYNLVLYLNLRTPGHRLYVLAMTTTLLFMALDAGLLQPSLPDWLRNRELLLIVLLNGLMLAATIRFFQVFAGSRDAVPRLHGVLSVVAALLLVVSLATLVMPVRWAAELAGASQLLVTLAVVLLLVSALRAGLRGSSAGWVFLAAWSAFLCGGLTRTLVSVDVLPRTGLTDYAVYAGSVMEALILALGLSYRVGQLRVQRMQAEREQHRAMQLANRDALTGAYNRRFFETYVQGLLGSLDRRNPRGALILMDIDRFKEINDSMGHDAGDVLLKALVDRCEAELREGDVLCRLGGDEFAVVVRHADPSEAMDVARRIRARITGSAVPYQDRRMHMTVSIGVLGRLDAQATVADALRAVDAALYEAKRSGRDRIVAAAALTVRSHEASEEEVHS
ncbi:MAG: diguanylate cyclase [Wenzhouxiangellaceae bacterium]|nr:diguanylate cyclase [Wenzhouxiangellaceae bacterium]